MHSTEIERIANDVVLNHLTEDIDYDAVYARDDCLDTPEHDLKAIYARVHEVLKQITERFRADLIE